MPEPYLSLYREQRANYYSLLPEHRPLVDKAYGVFEDFVRANDLESLEKRVFPIYQEYERLAASIGPSKPEPYYRLRKSLRAGHRALSGLAARMFDTRLRCGQRDKARDF